MTTSQVLEKFVPLLAKEIIRTDADTYGPYKVYVYEGRFDVECPQTGASVTFETSEHPDYKFIGCNGDEIIQFFKLDKWKLEDCKRKFETIPTWRGMVFSMGPPENNTSWRQDYDRYLEHPAASIYLKKYDSTRGIVCFHPHATALIDDPIVTICGIDFDLRSIAIAPFVTIHNYRQIKYLPILPFLFREREEEEKKIIPSHDNISGPRKVCATPG